MEWLSALLAIWTWLSLTIVSLCIVKIRYLRNSRESWRRYANEVYERSLNRSETVREGFSKEVSLALDTLIAADALTEREKSILLAVAYHAAPLEKDGRLLSSRILSQLAFEDALAR